MIIPSMATTILYPFLHSQVFYQSLYILDYFV
ncbi:hypothetical protein cco99_03012 [Campylobacter coli Z156]|nr:hypothetical protein cco99_03012 [Campylobacter coli Z156]